MSSYLPPETRPEWISPEEEESFWRDVDKQPNGCWHFRGAAGGRSGVFVSRTGNMAAHRAAWRLIRGEKLKGTEFLKPVYCKDSRCINPEHQSKVTRGRLRIQSQQHTANALGAHPSYEGLMSAEEIVAFLSQPGAASWTPKAGELVHVFWRDKDYWADTLEEACRAARDAA